MTFSRFESIFKEHYPQGGVVAHGRFGGTDKNKKTAVYFTECGKVYEYYGAYEDILCRLGIKVISTARLESLKLTLEHYRETNGTPSFFGGVLDHSERISQLEKELADIESNYIIV